MSRFESVSNDGLTLAGRVPGAQVVVLASAARTATPTKALQSNPGARGVQIVINVTAVGVTPSVVFTVQGYSALGAEYFTVLASAAVTATGTTVLRVYPGLVAAANLTANDVLPAVWAVDAVHGNGTTITYSVAATLLP